MLKISNHQRNANQNHNEISPHTYQNSYLSSINQQTTSAGRNRERGPFCPLVGMQIGAVTVESSNGDTSKKLKMDMPFDSVNSLLGIYLKEPKTLIQKNISTPMFIAVLFTIAKIWKYPKRPSVDEWIKQLWDIYTMEYYLAIKKKNTLRNSIGGPTKHYAK